MPITSINNLLETLKTLGLLPSAQIAELEKEAAVFPGPKELAKELAKRGLVTRFQLNQVFQGKGQSLVVGPYVLLEPVGEGGMGQVFKARHLRLDRVVALKIIRADRLKVADTVQRFQREAKAAAQLSHPHIVTLYDADQVGGTHFLAMEYVKGMDLARMIRERGPLPINHACIYIRQAAMALQHAHERGLVHRDIKPANLLVAEAGDQIKVLDMGLARLARPVFDVNLAHTLTQEGSVMGTPDYLAPEQAIDAHSVDIRGDIYSLGCTFYYLLTAQAPFPGGTLGEKLMKHQLNEPQPIRELRPEVPEKLAAVLVKMMAKKPEQRFQVPSEVAGALAPFCRQGSLMAIPVLPGNDLHQLTSQETIPGMMTQAPIELEFLAPTLPQSATEKTNKRTWGESGKLLFAWIAASRRRLFVVASGLVLALTALILLVVLQNRPRPTIDDLSAANIPPGERFTWQTRELVGVVGNHRWRHWAGVQSVAFNANGTEVASCGLDGFARIWNTATGQERLALNLPGNPTNPRQVLYSPDGKYLATLADGAVKLWQVASGREEQQLPVGSVTGLAFSPDNKTLALVTSGGFGFLCDYSQKTATPNKIAEQKEPRANYLSVAFSQDGNTLAIASAKIGDAAKIAKPAEITTWDVASGKQNVVLLPAETALVTSLAFSRGGDELVSASMDTNVVQVWDLKNKKARATFPSYQPTMALSPDGKIIAIAASQDYVRLWYAESGREIGILKGHFGTVAGIAFSHDSKTLATGGTDGAVKLWDVETKREKEETASAHASWLVAAALSPDRTLLATATRDHKVILWALPSLEVKNSFAEHTGPIAAMTFAPNGKMLATASQDKTITLWDLVKTQEIPTLTGHSDGVTCLAFSPDSKTLASGSFGSFVKLWDVAGRKEIATLKAQRNNGLAFFADGKKLVNCGGEQTLRIWDVETEKEMATLRGHSNWIFSLALAPDNKTLASGGQDGTIRFWDMALEKSYYGYKNQIAAWLLACAPLGGGPLGMPPQKYLEPPGQPEIASLTNPLSAPGITSYPYVTVRYSPDGKMLAAACQGGSISLFNAADRKKIPDILDRDRFPGTVHDVIFDSRGRHLITVNNNGTVYVLRLKDLPKQQ